MNEKKEQAESLQNQNRDEIEFYLNELKTLKEKVQLSIYTSKAQFVKQRTSNKDNFEIGIDGKNLDFSEILKKEVQHFIKIHQNVNDLQSLVQLKI